jgi:hypothetical protein
MKKYSINNSWINDLRRAAPESRFPDLDPRNMTEEDRDTLSGYLREDDGSLSEDDMAYSCDVADLVDALEPEEDGA